MFVLKPYSIIKTDITILRYRLPNEISCIKRYLWYVERMYMNYDDSDDMNYVPNTFRITLDWTRRDFIDQYSLWRDCYNECCYDEYPPLTSKWLNEFLRRPHLQISNNDIIVYLIDCQLAEWEFPSYNLKLILHD